MNKNILVAGLIIGMLTAINTNAATPTTKLELNPMLMNTSSKVMPQNNTTRIYATTKPAITQSTSYKYKTNTNNIQNIPKTIGKNDLTIEGHIEKTDKIPLYQNRTKEEFQDMIYTIGNKIVQANSINKNIKFVYEENQEVNANTNINNTIKVYKGLIMYCEDPDELAFILGHEIGHSASNDPMKSVATHTAKSVATAAALYGIGRVTNNSWAIMGVETAADLTTDMAKNKIQRVKENNADLLSVDYMVKAGYNPLAGISIMNKIGENYADFWVDHPSTDKRVIAMYNYVKEKYPQYISQGYNTTAYLQAIQDYIDKPQRK